MNRKLSSRYWLSIIIAVASTLIIYSTYIGLDKELCGCQPVSKTGTPRVFDGTARVLNGTAVANNSLRWVASVFIRYKEFSTDRG